MTLAIAVRCKDGAVVLADRRSRITENGKVRFDDDYKKIVRHPNALIYNHGYNRICDKDWKLLAGHLTANPEHPAFAAVSKEMLQKDDKHSAFVFVTPHSFTEISIDAGKQPRIHHFSGNSDRLLSGRGQDCVDLSPLSDLSRKSLSETVDILEFVFLAACKRLAEKGEDHFSAEFDIETIQ